MDSSEYDKMREVWFLMSIDQRISFIQTNIIIPTTKGQQIPLLLTKEQKKWFLDGPLFEDYTKKHKFHNRILLKIRNVGASLVMIATESVLCAWIYKSIFIPYISSGEDQANELIKHAKVVIENCKFTISLKGELKDQTKFEINFENGSRIKSFASNNPRGIRGPRALMAYIDEMAFVKYPQEIMSAVEFMASEGGQINVLSTPFGKQNLYWQIYSDKDNFVNYHRHRITLFDKMDNFDVKESLYDFVMKTGAKLTCPWLSLDFLENKRKSDAPFQYMNFLEEAVGIPVDERTAIITESMLDSYSMDEYLVEYRPLDAEGKKDMSRDFVVSIDFGADVNVTAVTVFECKNARFVVCYTEAFNGDFLEQVGKVKNIIRRFDPKFIIGDETGMGGKSWMSILTNDIGDCAVIGVNYSKKDIALEYGVTDNNKSFFVTTGIRLITEGGMIVPRNHARLREELLGMQKIVYEKIVKYSGKDGPAKGDDLAMSFLQASLLYNRVYEIDGNEGTGFVDVGIRMSKAGTKDKDEPRIKKAEVFTEVAGAKKNFGEERIRGFEKLI